MFKKITILALSLSLALAMTIGLTNSYEPRVEESEVTMCDLPFVKVSM